MLMPSGTTAGCAYATQYSGKEESPVILVDDRTGSKELLPYFQRLHVPCELARLEYGDAAFEGHGKSGIITIGVERKTLHDMLACVEDARYAAHQRPGMARLYSKSFLCIEGLWSCGDGNGMEGILFQGFQGGSSWGPLRNHGGRSVRFDKLYNYLISVALSGVIITYPSNISQTARHILHLFQYFQKPWHSHTSLLECQKLAIPTLAGKPSLVHQWASSLDDVGVHYGLAAEKHFKTAHALANSDELDWVDLTGPGGKRLGAKAARNIVKAIRGWK